MLGLSLHALEISGGAAPTRFASNTRSLATLPGALRTKIEGLDVVHMIDSVYGRDNIRTRFSDVEGAPHADIYPRFARPAIWQHPVLGVPLLFVLEQQASHFEGWSCADSDEVLDALFAHMYSDENIYEHDWREGDLVVWDNLALQHGRRANPDTVRRSLRRVTMNEVTTAELIKGTGFDPTWRRAHTAPAPGVAGLRGD